MADRTIMKSLLVLLVIIIVVSPRFTTAQNKTDTTSAAPSFTADYPKDRPGVLMQSSDWIPIPGAMPVKSRAKHGLAASLSYGAAPAELVADYDGPHAQVQVDPGRPVICVCRMISIPGEPVIVRLHPKKDSRELDGGRIHVLSSKIADASQNDLIPVEVSQPENTVWLVRPQQALPAGEYALMLGTRNINIFPFTVASSDSATPSGRLSQMDDKRTAQEKVPKGTAAESSNIAIRSTPDGAEITVDGKFVGSTPSTVRLEPGDHEITVQKSGFNPWKRTMTVRSGSNVNIDANLETQRPTLRHRDEPQ